MAEEGEVTKRRVSYTYDPEIGNYTYGQAHPMKPHRMRMAHNLIVNYHLYKHMERPLVVDGPEMTRFHTDDYVNFLRVISPDNMQDHLSALQRYAIGDDCPVFDGLFEFCQLYTSGSMGGASRLATDESDIVVNWSGGLHHAKKTEASGFCYVNDCVLAILELLKVYRRVLYIDIDIHHGDGVEEAFYTTDRVMTVSFHKFGEYFPGTGDWRDIGHGRGRNTALNFPLSDGVDDDTFRHIFRPILGKVMERYQPEAIVMQCGADSLSGDRLGCFNLSLRGHGDAVAYMRSFNVPMLVLGGGGYTIRNVARCWAYETSVLCGVPISDELPYNDFFEHYAPDYRLHIQPSNMENKNDRKYLDDVSAKLMQALSDIEIAPGTQIETGAELRTPKPFEVRREEEDVDTNGEASAVMGRRAHPAEFYDHGRDHDHMEDDTDAPAAEKGPQT